MAGTENTHNVAGVSEREMYLDRLLRDPRIAELITQKAERLHQNWADKHTVTFRKELAAKNEQNQHFHRRIKEIENTLHNTQVDHETCVRELRKTKKDLSERTKKYHDAYQAWQETTAELERMNPSVTIFEVDDGTMTSNWYSMSYLIRTITTTYFSHTFDPSRIQIQAQESLKVISPLYRNFLSQEGYSEYIFQALIWDCICEMVLQHPTLVFEGGVGRPAAYLIESLSKAVNKDPTAQKEYHEWRSRTGDLLDTHFGVEKQRQEQIATRLFNALRPFIPDTCRDSAGVQRFLSDIAVKATKLARIFAKVRPAYKCMRSQEDLVYGMKFDSSWMEAIESRPGCLVSLIVSPALIRWGDSEGEDYDQHEVLASARVLCLTKPKPQSDDKNVVQK
ncbi:hypothetical protein F4778DRAFT_777995 [Xylariomycetidae sp. FL2044]|nr:hypothetical protein F4778DRAFT_777995 [Xylariomycetidae sp. FL2044]